MCSNGTGGKLKVVKNKELALKMKMDLAKIAKENCPSHFEDFSGANVMAEWPIFYAYAHSIGPIVVASVAAQTVTKYQLPELSSPAPCIYLYHRACHFQRLCATE